MINVLANILTPQKARVGSPIGIESYGEARCDRATVQNPGSVDGRSDATTHRVYDNKIIDRRKSPVNRILQELLKKTVRQAMGWNTSAGASSRGGILKIFGKSLCSNERGTPFSKACNQ